MSRRMSCSAAALAAGEVADERARLVAAKAEAVAQQRGRDLQAARQRRDALDGLERLEHVEVAGDLGGVLREVGEPDGRAALDDARGRLELAAQQREQRRLARAVDADERDAVARAEAPRHVAQHRLGAERDASRRSPRAPCRRGATSRSAAARRGRAARARRRSARSRPRCGTSAWPCARAGRGAARRAPCAASCWRRSLRAASWRSRSARASTYAA